MVDVSITAASVVPGSDARTVQGISGATITAGQAVYLDTATNTWKLADANGATELIRKAIGIALTGSSTNQPIVVQKSGSITAGGTLTPGVPYYLSDTPGGICLYADVGTGEYVVQLGIATTAAALALDIQYPGVAL